MTEVLTLYKWTILGGALAGAALSLIGAQLAARNQSVQALVVAQAATLGVTIALIFRARFEAPHSHVADFLPLIGGTVASALFYFVCEWMVKKRWASPTTHFIGLFGLLMALTYVVVALVPALESHVVAAYFGDLSVASDHESTIIAIVSLVALVLMLVDWRRISDWSFRSMIFGQFLPSRLDRMANAAFLVGGMLMIAASVHVLGLLFTLSCLFLPVLVVTKRQVRLRGLATRLVVGALLGVVGGFTLSLWQGTLPTVPTIALSLLVASLIATL